MTIRGQLSDEHKVKLGGILREMRKQGASEDEIHREYERYKLQHAPIRSHTSFSFPENVGPTV